MGAESWVKKHDLVYKGATRHPFIHAIRDSSVDITNFRRWLTQDYLFVRKFTIFFASVLVKAGKESDDENDMEILLAGMASLNDEIAWFKKEATKWDVQLTGIIPSNTNQKYWRFLESLMEPNTSYTIAITALWAIETVYQQSFAYCLEEDAKTPPDLREACERWGSQGFAQYCDSLKNIVNRRIAKSTEDVSGKAEAAFVEVLEEEIEFWNMSEGKVK